MNQNFTDRFRTSLHHAGSALRALFAQNTQDEYPSVKLPGELKIEAWRTPSAPRTERERAEYAARGIFPQVLVHDPNLVVTVARKVMSRLIAGCVATAEIELIGGNVDVSAHPEYLYITKMKWGTGGHDPLDPTQPIPPTVADEALAAPIASPAYKPVTVDYPSYTSVRFTATLDQTEANGVGLSEEGLFCTGDGADEFMFARKTFGLLTKTSDFSFSFAHTVIF